MLAFYMNNTIDDTHDYAEPSIRLSKKPGYSPGVSNWEHTQLKVIFAGVYMARGAAIPKAPQVVTCTTDSSNQQSAQASHYAR